MKLLQRKSPLTAQGQRIMHPAATRTLQFDPSQDAETCKNQILEQFGATIAHFRNRASHTCAGCDPDIRWGILLWKPTLDEFLYFEERIQEPDPGNFYAHFVEGAHRGKPTRNLHIFEKTTNIKRYSVTMPEKGAKLQPYFDVPRIGQGAYLYTIPNDTRKPVWLTEETIQALQQVSKDKNQSIDDLILSILKQPS